MKYTITAIAPIENLEIDNTIELSGSYLPFSLKKGSILFPSLSNKFKSYIGKASCDLIETNTCCVIYLQIAETNEVPKDFSDPKIVLKFGAELAKFVHFLWFISDNSTFLKDCFLEIKETGDFSKFGISQTTYNSKGEYKSVKYSKEELTNYYLNILPKLNFPIQDEKSIKEEFKPIDNKNGYFTTGHNLVQYKKPRYGRALDFLSKIRQEERIIAKITFYMTMYECLFTSSSNEITETIARRASSIIAEIDNNQNSLAHNYAIIKEAYKIRCRYIHGDIITEKPENIQYLCHKIDDITRQIMSHIILLKDNSIFTTKETKAVGKKFKEYFESIVSKYYEPIEKIPIL